MAERPNPPEGALEQRAEDVERLREFIDDSSFAGDERDISGELSAHADQHPADGSDIVEQRARDYTIKQMLEAHAAEIEEARQRQAEGTYGTCANCGRPIGEERLRARPEATLCINCARERDAADR